ncbi:MAG TPA: hypothetical protein VF801_15225 [Rhodocyclaceae bacterium]
MTETKRRIYLLIKIFDKEEHADAFLHQGEMFCRTIGEFRRTFDDESRGDKYEGVTDWHQPGQVKLTISYKDGEGIDHSINIDEKDLAGPVVIQRSGFDSLNVFCMYAIKIDDCEETYETEEERLNAVERINDSLKRQSHIDEKLSALGDFAVIVYRISEFIDKVKEAAANIGAECVDNLVEYYDPETFNGSFDDLEAVFRKRDGYAHQNEYRFAFLLPEPEGTKTIRIGSLIDMAIKLPTKEINSRVQIRLDESRK